MKPISPWAAAAAQNFADVSTPYIFTKTSGDFTFNLQLVNDSLYLQSKWKGGGNISFRLAYSPAGDFTAGKVRESGTNVIVNLNSIIGTYVIQLTMPAGDENILK